MGKPESMFKSFYLTLLSCFVALIVFGQRNSTPELPYDEQSGRIAFSDVVHVSDSASADEIYVRAREWFARTYRSSMDVLQMDDRESGRIIGKASFSVTHRALGANYPSGYFRYTISIHVRDGRYRYEVSDFYHMGDGNKISDSGPIEEMINTTHRVMGISMQRQYNEYLNQLANHIPLLVADLKESLDKSGSGSFEDDDW